MTAIILAGGKSSRMGYDKAFIKVGGTVLIKRQLKLLKSFFKEIIIVTNTPHKYRLRGVKVIKDIIPGQGPLGGIYSGLVASSSTYNFVVACDMPFINLQLIKYMVSLKDNFDTVVPRIKNGYEPLFAIYAKNCIPIIENALKENKLNVSTVFQKAKTIFISQREIEKFDKKLLFLANINTQDELAMLR